MYRGFKSIWISSSPDYSWPSQHQCLKLPKALGFILSFTSAPSPEHWAQLLWQQQIWFNSTNWPVIPLMTTVSLIKHLMPPNSHFEPIKAGERQIIKQLSYKTQPHLAAAHFPNCRIIKHKARLFIRIKGMENWFCCLAKRHCHPYGYLCWIPAQPELQVCNIPSCRRGSLQGSSYYFFGAYQKPSVKEDFLLFMFPKSLPALFDHKQIQQNLLTVCF